ncbi:chromosome partitioning protein ParB [Chromatiales bacterium (ex Bugula neritina AB1)]|nr:chromosome partitioning protein ParB [Chromatiales bacterium (ex Bugula neritina AB1)]
MSSPSVGDARSADADIVSEIPVTSISRGTYQPRKHFDEETLQELADSILAQGLIQPVLLRKRAGGFELIAGERRWRAAQLAGLETVPAIVRDMDDSAVAAITLIENIQREDLNPLEEAQALHRLKNEFNMTHQAVAEAVGRSRASVTNLLRLLDLDERVSEMLVTGKIEMGHARALLSLTPDQQHIVALKVYAEGLSVRATEALVRNGISKPPRSTPKRRQNSHIKALEVDLSEKLGAQVTIDHRPGDKGTVNVSYNSLDELDGILAHIK